MIRALTIYSNEIEKNDLYLQDLGYFKLKPFGTILNKGADLLVGYSINGNFL